MAAHELQDEPLIGQKDGENTHFDHSPTMLHSRSPSPEIFDILEATTVKLAHNMTAFTQMIREKRHSAMYYDERYMSSEEALSLSPAGEELNLTDEETDDLEVDDVLEDIMEEGEEEMQWNRSRSNSKSSVVIDQAIELKITKVGKPKLIKWDTCHFADDSTSTSVISRQASTIKSHSDNNSVFMTPESSPETTFEPEKPSIPLRIRPTLQSGWTSQASSFNPASFAIPPRQESLADATADDADSSPVTPQSILSTPINSVAGVVATPVTPATPITPTKNISFFNKVGSKFSGLSKKEKHTAVRISGPTDFQKLTFTPEALATYASSELPSSPIISHEASLPPKTPTTGKFTPIITAQHPMTPVMKIKDSDTSSIISKSSRFFQRNNSFHLHRTPSTATTYTQTPKTIELGKMEPRPAAGFVSTKDISDFLVDAKNEGSMSFMDMLNGSRASVVEADNISTAVPKRKPVPGSIARDKKRLSFRGLGGHHGTGKESGIAI